MKKYNVNEIKLTKYLFFTGKGGVGKTSVACATSVSLADQSRKVLLISTDPASNLQDVFKTELDGHGREVGVNNLTVVNLDPIKAAAEYRESVIAPYRGKLPQTVLANMEEQLSGSCTVEIAAFNEFTKFLADKDIESKYDYIIFDTAPTGHTLRMLQLPSAWSNFISNSVHGASCLGQLSGLEDKKEVYRNAVNTLCDGKLTTLVLVTRPDTAPLKEAEKASCELSDIGVKNQILVVNGVLEQADDSVSKSLMDKQIKALSQISKKLQSMNCYFIPLRAYNILGLNNIRKFLSSAEFELSDTKPTFANFKNLQDIINDLYSTGKRVIFTMGKGGVGKTTIAATIAVGLAEKGLKVHLTTTDPAAHIGNVLTKFNGIKTSFIDEKLELKTYQETVLAKASETMRKEDIEYIEEDLRSPCTQEIAVFRAFANIVESADSDVVVIDTAPTGHTLLLLDSTQSYHKEVKRGMGDIPENVKNLLPRLKNGAEAEVIIVTLAEATPVYEALRLEEDLKRAEIAVKWWIINSSYYKTNSSNSLLASKAEQEIEWINKVAKHSSDNFAVLKWRAEDMKNASLNDLINEK